MTPAVLVLENLTRHFGAITAVDAVNLTLEPGEFVSFLGPSGSGKTTTLMMVAGLQTPDSGSIRLHGQEIGRTPPYKRNIGMVFQNYALFPHLTVAANVAFPLQMRRTPRAEITTRVQQALALVGLPDHGARLPTQLSGGQQQRVALARALVYRPPLLLMDEPLGALDKNLREQMQLEITRLHRELGMTVLYVTHDQQEALVMSDRIAVFNQGRIEQIGPPQQLYERPATSFVAGFIGDSSFIEGHVTHSTPTQATIETPYGPLQGHPATTLTPGTPATVAIRPERLHLTPIQNGNTITARLTEIIYLGQSRKLILRLPQGEEITAHQPLSAHDPALIPGQQLPLHWHPAECNVLPK